MYKAIGIFADEEQINNTPHVDGARPGDIILEDYNNDGQITLMTGHCSLKHHIPEITFGLSFNLSYKSWSLNGLFQGAGNMMKQSLYRLYWSFGKLPGLGRSRQMDS